MIISYNENIDKKYIDGVLIKQNINKTTTYCNTGDHQEIVTLLKDKGYKMDEEGLPFGDFNAGWSLENNYYITIRGRKHDELVEFLKDKIK